MGNVFTYRKRKTQYLVQSAYPAVAPNSACALCPAPSEYVIVLKDKNLTGAHSLCVCADHLVHFVRNQPGGC